MDKRKVISGKNQPLQSGISFALIVYLLLDKFNVNPILFGILGGLYVGWLVLWIVDLFTSERIDVFDEIDKL